MNSKIYSSGDNLVMQSLIEKQAECFLIDAEEYRSIDHRINEVGLKLYNFLYSKFWSCLTLIVIVALHCLAFLEFPSSLYDTSDIYNKTTLSGIVNVPKSLTLSLEAIFLLIILSDGLFQMYVSGWRLARKNPWLICMFVLIFISWIDFFVSIAYYKSYFFRLRRFFRPFFAMQKSQLMKKVLKSLSKTLKDIASVFCLLILWLIAFTLFAMALFNGFEKDNVNKNFDSFFKGMWTLLVLLTTANNPDAMVEAFNKYRLSFLLFLIFMSVGIFVFMNVLMAVVFNEFRNHVLDSMQTSLSRRRVATRAFFEVLKGRTSQPDSVYQDEVDVNVMKRVINNSSICNWRKLEMIKLIEEFGAEVVDWTHVKNILAVLDEHKESKMIIPVPKYENSLIIKCQRFVLSKSFEIIGMIVSFANVVVIAVDVSFKFDSKEKEAITLEIFNWIFIVFYLIEQTIKFLAMGYKTYFSKQGCIVEFFITLTILGMKIYETIALRDNDRKNFLFGTTSAWDLPRITNLLIMARAARIILFIPSLTPIINTLFDIPWRMKSVIGVMSLLFYLYALLGMNILGGKIDKNFMNKSCSKDFVNLKYTGIHFNDFYSSIVVLWCLLIVNNWHVFTEAFDCALESKGWIYIYVISWWVISVVVVLNCVTAFVIEAYTHRKSFYEEDKIKRMRPRSVTEFTNQSIQFLRSSAVVNNSFTFQMLFKNDLVEPTEEELVSALKRCHFLCYQYPHIALSTFDS